MATYEELYGLRSNSVFLQKVTVAVAKKAQLLLDGGTPTVAEVTWASAAIQSPRSEAEALANYVLAANSTASVGAITGASDSLVQTNVNSAIDAIIAGGA